jgi:hypothetical protein
VFAQLGESIRSLIDEAYKEHVLFTDLQEYYQFEVVSKAMRVLVRAVCLVLPRVPTRSLVARVCWRPYVCTVIWRCVYA